MAWCYWCSQFSLTFITSSTCPISLSLSYLQGENWCQMIAVGVSYCLVHHPEWQLLVPPFVPVFFSDVTHTNHFGPWPYEMGQSVHGPNPWAFYLFLHFSILHVFFFFPILVCMWMFFTVYDCTVNNCYNNIMCVFEGGAARLWSRPLQHGSDAGQHHFCSKEDDDIPGPAPCTRSYSEGPARTHGLNGGHDLPSSG